MSDIHIHVEVLKILTWSLLENKLPGLSKGMKLMYLAFCLDLNPYHVEMVVFLSPSSHSNGKKGHWVWGDLLTNFILF